MKIKKALLPLLSASMLSLCFSGEAMASHFRGGYITWERISGNSVKFTVQTAWRADAPDSVLFQFGDGATLAVQGTQVAVGSDLGGNQYKVFKQEFTHIYAGSGPYNAGFSSCCRISNLANASNGNFLLYATVNGSQQGGSVTSIPYILQVPKANNLINIPVVDPDGTASCRLATAGESGFSGYPAGFTITPACKLSWDASAAPHATKVAAQLIMEQGGFKTPYDFIVEVNGNLANHTPTCTLNGNASNSVSLNSPFSISVTASDQDFDPLTVTHLGLPGGATLTPPSGTNGASPMTATFNWTPSAVGQNAVSLIFTDNHNQNCQSSFTIEVKDAPPIANAGADTSINEAASYQLDGSGSYDPDGKALTYSWTQTGGPTVTLFGASTATPTVTVPYFSDNKVLTFELSVSDGTSKSSDTVDITVVNSNHAPIADAGNNSSIKEGATAHLDGTGSYDQDNEAVQTYKWTQVAGPAVSLLADTTNAPFFTAALGSAGETIIFRLDVSDGKEFNTNKGALPDPNQAGDDLVSIKVVANSLPIANAGADQTRDEGNTVSLNGNASSDPDSDTLTYKWQQTGGNAWVTLDNESSPTPGFVAPWVAAGGDSLVFQLMVTDGDPYNPKSAADEVVINVRNANDPPSCNLAQPSVVSIWPPNHKMVPVTIDNIGDSQDNNWTLDVTSVTQDEPINATGDGDTEPDASIVHGPRDSVTLRAERAGTGNGRVYTVNFIAGDGKESCTGSVKVTVPRDRNGVAIDSGQAFISTQQ